MQPRSFEQRLTMLEQQIHECRELPDRINRLELQIVQLRDEMRGEISATRSELRTEIRDGNAETRAFMRALHEHTGTTIATMGEGKKGRKPKT